jgi:NAD(P)-dependent dehydrogenase (short-subunit alcohol dehydrogenase family)
MRRSTPGAHVQLGTGRGTPRPRNRTPQGGIMTTATPVPATRREPRLLGQTVVLIGGSAGIGLETARQARSEGADVVLTGRDPDRLEHAAADIQPLSTAAFDATDFTRLERFFRELPGPIDHVLVTAAGAYYARLADIDFSHTHHDVEEHLWLPIHVARAAVGKVRPAGTLLFVGGTGPRRPGLGLTIASAVTGALPALIANLALEVAPIRVNLIAAGFVDTSLSARLLGDHLEERRNELRATLPIGRVVGPADVAALAVHLMTNTAVTGATYDIDGGEQIIRASDS